MLTWSIRRLSYVVVIHYMITNYPLKALVPTVRAESECKGAFASGSYPVEGVAQAVRIS